MEKKVFISHSSKDEKIAHLICEYLESRGIGCWIAPRDIPYEDWAGKITMALKSCKMVLFLYSENSNSSEYCLNEIYLSKKLHLPIYMIAAENTDNINDDLCFLLVRNQMENMDEAQIRSKPEKVFAIVMGVLRDVDEEYADDDGCTDELFFDEEEKYRRRFSYNARSTGLIGRQAETAYLMDFCVGDPAKVSWTVISGEGGAGKSKLAFEFCDRIELAGWNARRPVSARSRQEDIRKQIDRISCDTVVCLDYVKFELDAVMSLIKAAINRKTRFRIRFILIEREAESIINSLSFSSEIASRHYRCGTGDGDLRLSPLCDKEIRLLIDDYTRHVSDLPGVPETDKDKICKVLSTIDPDHTRPLFVLFVTEAWLDGKLDEQKWNKEAFVKYIAMKEIERIYESVNSLPAPHGELYHAALRFLVAYTTFINRAAPDELVEIAQDVFRLQAFEAERLMSGYFRLGRESLAGIEPDLIGEYACIEILNTMEPRYADAFFERLNDRHFYETITFAYKISADYDSAFSAAAWKNKLTDITIPESISYLKNELFGDCTFIERVRLHKQVTKICKYAFRDCTGLTEINFPNALETIEEAAFLNCTSLRSAMPDDGKGWVPSVISIGDRAFKNCTSLKDFVLPRSVQTLGRSAFEKCASLESIWLTQSISCIEACTFLDCTSLRQVSFPKQQKKKPDIAENEIGNRGIRIKEEAFRGCTALERVRGWGWVTAIGKRAFSGCASLRTLSFSARLSYFDSGAFEGCGSLMTVDMAQCDGLKAVAEKAFISCLRLERVCLPQKLRVIKAAAFCDCPRLCDIALPPSVNAIGARAFSGCRSLGLKSFGKTVPRVKDFCGFIVRKIDQQTVLFAASCYDTADAVLPAGIIGIGDGAFRDAAALRTLTVSSQITHIGEEAFCGCTGLREIRGSFQNVDSLGAGAFAGCESLREIPPFEKISEIPSRAFNGCKSLETVRFLSDVSRIGRSAFAGCESLRRLDLPSPCGMLSENAFAGCDSFDLTENVHICSSDGRYYVGGFVFSRFGDKEKSFLNQYRNMEAVIVPTSCVGIFEHPFRGLKQARSVIVPDSVVSFPGACFSDMPNLTEIRLPDTLGGCIGKNFFKGCRSLKTFQIGSCEENTVPHGFTPDPAAFEGCKALENITLPDGLTVISAGLFKNCSSLKEIRIPKSVERIETEAFSGCGSLTATALPEALKYLGYSAFRDCVSLQTVRGLEDARLDKLMNETFRGCVSLREIRLPRDLKTVSSYCFYDCRSLTEIDLAGTEVTRIGTAAFQNCFMLKEFVVPFRVTKIDMFTFKNCNRLEKVILPPDISSIGNSAFFGCNSLTDINTEDKNKLTSIGEYAFSDCHRLESISIPENITALPRGLFRRCVSLKSAELHAAIRSIPDDCFYGCKELVSIRTDSEITRIGAGAFRNCGSLADLSVFSDITWAAPAAFRACRSVEKAVFTRLSSVSPAMFMECTGLRHIGFPEVKAVGKYAFCDCTALETVPMDHIVERIEEGAFWNCTRLPSPIFSHTLTGIRPSAFRFCRSLEKVEFPDGVTAVHSTVFRGADSLKTVIIPASVTAINASAFRDCASLTTVQIRSEDVTVKRTAFADCKQLYYFTFAGHMCCDISSFDNTPVLGTLKKNKDVEWTVTLPTGETKTLAGHPES